MKLAITINCIFHLRSIPVMQSVFGSSDIESDNSYEMTLRAQRVLSTSVTLPYGILVNWGFYDYEWSHHHQKVLSNNRFKFPIRRFLFFVSGCYMAIGSPFLHYPTINEELASFSTLRIVLYINVLVNLSATPLYLIFLWHKIARDTRKLMNLLFYLEKKYNTNPVPFCRSVGVYVVGIEALKILVTLLWRISLKAFNDYSVKSFLYLESVVSSFSVTMQIILLRAFLGVIGASYRKLQEKLRLNFREKKINHGFVVYCLQWVLELQRSQKLTGNISNTVIAWIIASDIIRIVSSSFVLSYWKFVQGDMILDHFFICLMSVLRIYILINATHQADMAVCHQS